MASSTSPTSPATSPTSPSSISSSDRALPRRKPRVSAEHTLNRVRENQRRHRARQKDHVASLELRLAEAERELAAARAEIESLRAERDVANAFVCLDVSRHFERMDSVVTTTTEGGTYVAALNGPDLSSTLLDLSSNCNVNVDADDEAPTFTTTSFQLLPPAPPPVLDSKPPPGPPPCCTDDLPPPSLDFAPAVKDSSSNPSPECTSCATRPPPSPSESTTLCAQAFILISQRNVRNLDPALIRLWLSRGYRRAVKEGEGCRVEDGTLRGLLEYISGV